MRACDGSMRRKSRAMEWRAVSAVTGPMQATTGGTLIGGLRTPRIATRTFSVAAGDTLVLYSDGLIEASCGPGAERYGEDALQAFLTQLAPTTAPAAVEALTGLLTSLERLDDVAIMALSLSDGGPE